MCKIKRVRYEKCPLIEVTYQLNFPTILSIEAEMPVKYQNAIRKNFPQYRTQTEQEGEITVNINGEEVNPIFRQRPIKKNSSLYFRGWTMENNFSKKSIGNFNITI